MKAELFDQLVDSVKEAGKIHRGEIAPCRKFEVTPLNIKELRAKLNKSQIEFAKMIGCERCNFKKLGARSKKPCWTC